MRAWERQPEESARAYEAFTMYRDLGPQRSIAKVAQALGKSRALLERWSARHEWVSRVEALEARDAMIAREAVEAHLEAKASDFAQREAQLREKALSLREQLAEQAEKMLEWPLTQQQVIREDDPSEDGETVTYVFMPSRWSKSTAAQFYSLVVGNAPTTPEEPELDFDFDAFTDEEIEEYIRLADKLGIKPPSPE